MFDQYRTVRRVSPLTEQQTTTHPAVKLAERLAALGQLTQSDLRAEWRRLYRAHPPKKISRDLLELAVAWKLQEKMLGRLGSSFRRRLGTLAWEMETRGDLEKARAVKLKSGARLIREWQGETHDVLVLDGGFRWRGRHWSSLSAIAREITGTHWSGPRFFGLRNVDKKTEPIRTASGASSDERETSRA
jgi:hypothetical protein